MEYRSRKRKHSDCSERKSSSDRHIDVESSTFRHRRKDIKSSSSANHRYSDSSSESETKINSKKKKEKRSRKHSKKSKKHKKKKKLRAKESENHEDCKLSGKREFQFKHSQLQSGLEPGNISFCVYW